MLPDRIKSYYSLYKKMSSCDTPYKSLDIENYSFELFS